MRDDYRLRARLADAESLARKLIDIEARLGLHLDGGRAQPKPLPPPTAVATDGPADLDAKADILADQARRLRGQAEAMGRRSSELKGRQELRKRVADLDRDLFGAHGRFEAARRERVDHDDDARVVRDPDGGAFRGARQRRGTPPPGRALRPASPAETPTCRPLRRRRYRRRRRS